MPSRYNLNLRKIAAEVEAHIDDERRAFELAKRRYEENPKGRLYTRYGVDNDFDLVEAMYDENYDSTGNLLGSKAFNNLRRECVMNPEYTERCLESDAFWDMKDEILERLNDVK